MVFQNRKYVKNKILKLPQKSKFCKFEVQRSKVNLDSKPNFNSILYYFQLCILHIRHFKNQNTTFFNILKDGFSSRFVKAYGLHSAPLQPKPRVEILRNLTMQVCISFSSSVCVLFSFFLSFCKLIRHSKRERNARGQKVLHFLAERHSEHSSIRRRSRRNLGVRGSKGNLLSSVRDRIRK